MMNGKKPVREKSKAELKAELNSVRLQLSEIKKAEKKALIKSEEKYLSLLNQLPLGVYRTTKKGNFLYANQVLVNILECSSIDELLRSSAQDFYKDQGERDKQLKKWKKKKTIVRNVLQFKTKQGRLIWARDTGSINFNDKGEIEYISGIIEDITDRKLTEEALKESEEKYRTLFETMAQGVIYQNVRGKIIFANPAAERILGLSVDEMKTIKLRDPKWKFIHEDWTNFSWESHPAFKALNTGKKVSNVVMGVYNALLKGYKWININCVPQFKVDETKPYQVYSTIDDITERKRAETIQNVLFNISKLVSQTYSLQELIPEIHQQVNRLMDARNFYVALIHDKQKNLFTFPYIVDVVPEELVEPDVPTDLSGGFTNYVLRKEKPLLANKKKFQSMLIEEQAKLIGTKAKSWLGVPLVTTGGEVIGVVVVQSYDDPDAYTENDQDVLVIISSTIAWAIKFKQTEAEKRELEEKLIRSEKMEALGRLAGGVAHDLNNVLSAMVGYPDLISRNLPKNSPLRRPVDLIQKSGHKAAAIVDDLLSLARRGVPIKEVVNLKSIITEYLKSPVCKKLLNYHPEVEIETILDDDIFNIKGSQTHLNKMVMNLVSNAAEAMPEGGKLFISVSNCYIDKPKKMYDVVVNEGNYILLEVADSGVGIPSKDLVKIFEPFYTKKVMGRSGTGLGMAVVWGTIKDHKGHINIESKVGVGTTLKIYLPITKEEICQQYKKVPIKDYSGKGENILVVDDVQDQLEIATVLLTNLGYSVNQVSSGKEAIEYVKCKKVDLILLDMIMEPGIDGLDTFKKIKEIVPDQKTIIVSGFSESERIKEAQRLGVGKYVKKPYTIEKLGLAIRSLLDG